jgi:hypothetical protein
MTERYEKSPAEWLGILNGAKSIPTMVGVTGFEPAASCSQSRRATNCATPRIARPCRKEKFGLFIIAQQKGFVKRDEKNQRTFSVGVTMMCDR